MTISILDDTLQLRVFFDKKESRFDDDICLCIRERCPDEEKLFIADETNIYLKPEEAALLVLELERALEAYRRSEQEI